MKTGNYLAKYRVNFYLSEEARRMIHVLSVQHGVSHTAVVELAVREKFTRDTPPDAPADAGFPGFRRRKGDGKHML